MNFLAFTLTLAVVAAQYVPERYGWACYRMAAKRDWPACASVSRSKQRECLCQIPEFVVLTEACLQNAVINSTDPESAKATARRESLCMLPDVSSDLLSTVKNPAKYAGAYEMEYVDPIDSDEINIAIHTADWRMTNDRRATRAGVVLVAYWGVILLVRYAASVFHEIVPWSWVHYIMMFKNVKKVRARFLNSPLGRNRHCEPCLGFLGIRLPTRVFSVLIAIFAAINYLLIFTNFPYDPLNFIYTSPRQQYNKSLAIRAAFMIMWKIPLLVCFAGRNNVFMLMRHPWPLDTFSVLHKWIARITIVDIIIHSVAISLVKAEQGLYGAVWKVDYWRWGVVGTVITSLIAFQSMHWLSRRNYDLFVAIHVVLGALFLAAAWYHVYSLPYGIHHIIVTCAIWVFDRAVRLARMLVVGKVRADVVHTSNVTILTIEEPKLYGLVHSHCSNAYAFLHVPSWYLFWQSHPFTIVKKGLGNLKYFDESASDTGVLSSVREPGSPSESTTSRLSRTRERPRSAKEEKTQLMICIKHRRGVTKYISRLREGPLSIVLDGPYGHSHPLHQFSKIIFFAGGIGITPVLSYAKRALELCPDDVEIQIHWAVSELGSMRWAIEELSALYRHVSLIVYVSGQEKGSEVANDFGRRVAFIYQRLKCLEIVKTEVAVSNALHNEINTPFQDLSDSMENKAATESAKPEKSDNSFAIFSCGPNKLNDDARVSACWAIENANVYVNYYEESFSW